LKGEETVFVSSVTQKHVTFHALDLDAIFIEDRPVVYPSGLGPGGAVASFFSGLNLPGHSEMDIPS